MDLTVYRIIQEALTNSLRHGGPNVTAAVSVLNKGDHLEVSVLDDGRGAAARDTGGHGLAGMAERVALFDGKLRSGPAPGGGFSVRATLPLNGSP